MISIIVNLDSRPASNEATEMFNGVRGGDLMVETIRNKRKFFEGFDIEVIAYVDEHQALSSETVDVLRGLCDCLVIRKHRKHYRGAEPFGSFNDVNYLHALSLARGEYIAHFDQDMVAFAAEGSNSVRMLIDWLNGPWKYVSYPSPYSPRPTNDESFGNHVWASTRFFMCRKETIDLKSLEEAIVEPQTLYARLGTPPRVCPWTEHHLGQMAGYSVYYPKPSKDLLIFPFHKYKDGVLGKLNQMSYEELYYKVVAAGAESYHGCEGDRLLV